MRYRVLANLRRIKTIAPAGLLLLLVMVSHGCRANQMETTGPGATAYPEAPPASAAATDAQGPPTDGVQQASHETMQPGVGSPSGQSLTQFEDEEESDWVKSLEKLAPSNVYKSAKSAMGLGPDEPIAQRYYAEGEQFFKGKQYSEAADKFKSAAGRWPDSALEEDAMFMLAESYFFADNYRDASDTYGNLQAKYTRSRHIDTITKRQFAIARYWEEVGREKSMMVPSFDKKRPFFDTAGNAIAQFESVHTHDPTGPLADDAIMAAGNAEYRRGHFEDAAHFYGTLRKSHPQSEHQRKAHELDLYSNLSAYQGPQYDARALIASDKILKSMKANFPPQSEEERARMQKFQRLVRYQQAERDWNQAEYYYNLKYYGASRKYYDLVVKEHADTPFANKASARLAEIQNYPPEPPNHFKWFTELFPESKKR